MGHCRIPPSVVLGHYSRISQISSATPAEMSVLEGSDVFAQDFINQERRIADDEIPSEIQNFFTGSTVLVTGATGFMGKVLIEKLLRTCWRLKNIYVIIRTKKGKNPNERFAELFDGPLYDRLKMERPNFREQIVAISGDCSLPEMGLSDEDKQTLVKNVDIVFHCAATVRFDEKLRVAVNINMNGTRCIMNLGREMKNLKSLIHVSTAYSNCPQKEIEEKFYKSPMHYKDVFQLIDILDDTQLETLTPSLLGSWPNTYTYTKAISETMVRELGKGLPVAVIRPSIVTSTAFEPVCGWINNFFGPQGVTVGAALGMLRTLHCDPNVLADMVPVDFVINASIALAWDIGQTKGDNPNFEKISMKEAEEVLTPEGAGPAAKDADDDCETSEIPVVNFVSSEKRPIRWGEFMQINLVHGQALGSMMAIWHYTLTLNPNYHVDKIYQIFLHYLPALIVDVFARLIGRKPILWDAYKKISKFSKVISYFCTSQWKFHDDNVWKMWNKLSEKDKQLFNFNIAALEWESYMGTYIRGLRVYLTKDDISTVPQAKRRIFRLKILHYIVVTCIASLFLLFIWKVYSSIFLS